MKNFLLAVTQRIMVSPPHGERRDALARDWHPFLKALGRPWLALPNEAETAVDLAARLDVGGLLLTGGDDIGQFPERDETEAALLNWARENSRPVIGVCRGFQFIHHHLGGRLAPVDPARHRARRHEIELAGGKRRLVNSYHNLSPDFSSGGGPWRPLAVCPDDGAVEAAEAPGLIGLMWHPEREEAPQREDLDLFSRHLA